MCSKQLVVVKVIRRELLEKVIFRPKLIRRKMIIEVGKDFVMGL